MMGRTRRKDFKGAQIRSPITECSRMIVHSSGVRRPGFNRIASGMATFPTSCTIPARRSATSCSSGRFSCSPSRAEYSASRSQCPCVYGSFPSMLRARVNKTDSAHSSSSVRSLSLSRERTRASNSVRSTGRVKKSSAPDLIPSMRSCLSDRAVIRITGIK